MAGCFLITQGDIDDRQPTASTLGPSSIGVVAKTTDGRPIADATAVISGAIAATNRAGMATLNNLPPGESLVSIFSDGRAPGYAWLNVRDGQGGGVQFTLEDLAVGRIHRAEKGGAIAHADTWSLAFPGDAWRYGGALPQGAVDVRYAWPEQGSLAPPARMAASSTSETPVSLDLHFAVVLEGADYAGHSLELERAGTWRVNVPQASSIRDLTNLGLYFFDPAVGFWVERGGADFETSYLVGTVSEFGWWAFASPSFVSGCVRGYLREKGENIAGEVLVAGAGHMGVHRVYTDQNGEFCAPAQPGHTLLYGFGLDQDQSHLYLAESGASVLGGGSCEEDSCTDIGVLTPRSYEDRDGDGFFDVPDLGGDCDDSDNTVHPEGLDVLGDGVDSNCDGVDGVDRDGDGYAKSLDCDDADRAAFPGATETCDEVDNDCDGLVDEDPVGAIAVGALGCRSCRTQSTIDLGPVLYWTLDDTSDYVLDSSGWGRDGDWGAPYANEYDGIAQGTAKTPMWEGVLNQYARLDDFDDFPTDELTVSIWWKPRYASRGVVSYYIPLEAPADRSCALPADQSWRRNEFILQPHEDGIRIAIGDVQHIFDGEVPLNSWSHIVTTWRGSTGEVELYLNDTRLFASQLVCEGGEDTGLDPGPVKDIDLVSHGSLWLGQDQDCYGGCNDGYQSYEGLLDEFAVFDRVLTEDEVSVIYLATTCGEGTQLCNLEDDDVDGVADEHLRGTDFCPAEDCQAIVDNGADRGDGTYWVEGDAGPTVAYCDQMPQAPVTHLCGDGVVFSPLETCDPPGEGCSETCALEVLDYGNCHDYRSDFPSATSGPYVMDPEGLGLETLTVRCEMDAALDGGGWTLVHRLDTGPNELFLDLDEALLIHEADPFDGKYSILSRLEQFRGETDFAGFDFLMRWPWTSDTAVEIWRQDSNPVSTGDVSGFSVIVGGSDPHFIGLHLHDVSGTCHGGESDNPVLLDGSDQDCTTILDYAVGLLVRQPETSYGLPGRPGLGGVGADGSTKEVQLWVRPNSDP
jgi:hypothetical protein